VLASGACLVCSAEIAARALHRDNLDDRSAVIIADPRDHETLACRLRALIGDRDRAWAMGRQGQLLARFWDEEAPQLRRRGQDFRGDGRAAHQPTGDQATAAATAPSKPPVTASCSRQTSKARCR
jgi:hypothetical protein